MKLRVIATLALALVLAVGSASAQSIGVFFDPAGATCSANIPVGGATIYVMATLGGAAAAGMTGAEFRVDGLPSGYFGSATPSPASNIAVGNPFAGGANIAFPSCQPGSGGIVLLFTWSGFASVAPSNLYLTVLQHSTPSNPQFLCPLLVLCDAPVYSKLCVTGGVGIINGGHCTVAVEPATWSKVKGLYN